MGPVTLTCLDGGYAAASPSSAWTTPGFSPGERSQQPARIGQHHCPFCECAKLLAQRQGPRANGQSFPGRRCPANGLRTNFDTSNAPAMYFASDNWAGAAPEILESIREQAAGFADSYGVSPVDRAVEAQFNEVFEREVAVFFVGTGTAANALALASVNKPGGAVFCHRESHIVDDECGAVEFQTGGARLFQLDGPAGKLDPEALESSLARFMPGFVHAGQPMAVSVTQATEAGGVYSLEELRALSAIARTNGLPLHMDGARFANALVHLDVSPAEMTWRSGVDILSFGGTKNGCICAEALVFFDPAMA